MLENAQQQPAIGEGTVLRPKEEFKPPVTPNTKKPYTKTSAVYKKAKAEFDAKQKAVTEEPVPAAKQPTKLTKEQKIDILDRMGMNDDELASLIDPKTEILPLNLKAFTEETDVQKAMASVLEQIGGAVK